MYGPGAHPDSRSHGVEVLVKGRSPVDVVDGVLEEVSPRASGVSAGRATSQSSRAGSPRPASAASSVSAVVPWEEITHEFEAVKTGRYFNVLDTLLVGSTSRRMRLDDAFSRKLFGESYGRSLWFQFRVVFQRQARLMLRNKQFIIAHIFQVWHAVVCVMDRAVSLWRVMLSTGVYSISRSLVQVHSLRGLLSVTS